MLQRAHTTTVRAPVFGWIPDAAGDPHPRRTWLLELGFDIWVSAAYRREIIFPDDFHLDPGTLIASNHQRDVDGPMLGTVLVRRRGLRFQWPLPFYATREDLFQRGILARLTVHWPKPLPALLGRISLGWFFPLGRAEPMRRVREFTLEETLCALMDAGCGNNDCASLLNARGRRETGAIADALPLRAALDREDVPWEAWWGLRRLKVSALGRIAPGFRATVAAQLRHFAQRLDQGDCVYFSPEGSISTDGHFGRIRAGFFRVCRMTAVPPTIQPMNLSYDTLAPGRSRVVIRIGRAFRADPGVDRRGFDVRLRKAVLDLGSVTPSHLIARFLVTGPERFDTRELTDWLHQRIETAAAHGAMLDPLFARTPLEKLARERLRWLAGRKLVVRDGGAWRNVWPRDSQPGWHGPANVVRCLSNGLEDIVPDLEKALPQ